MHPRVVFYDLYRRVALAPPRAQRSKVSQHKQQSVSGGRQGVVLIHANPACGPGFPIEAPSGHLRLEHRLQGRNQLLKRVERLAGAIQERCGETEDRQTVHWPLMVPPFLVRVEYHKS